MINQLIERFISWLNISNIQVSGNLEVEPYSSKETPMMIYVNTHAALEQLRLKEIQLQILKNMEIIKWPFTIFRIWWVYRSLLCPFNGPSKHFLDLGKLFNKIAEICKLILKNLTQKSSWFKKPFGGLTYCIGKIKWRCNTQ